MDTVVNIGPVIIDFTPPVYDGGIDVDLGNIILFSWHAQSFYDAEDTTPIRQFEWSLGM